MPLSEYKRKRDFALTPEPGPRQGSRRDRALRFVVQEHRSARRHYDLRLEAGGVLKSWAVPKGPSLDPRERRLAMMVEDHPLDYADFEGVIPPGNYGAGSVTVWDKGTYSPAKSQGDAQEAVERGISEGKLAFVLRGKKLKGEFYLIRMRRARENAWLLEKKDDEFSSTRKIDRGNVRALSGAKRAPIPERVRPMLATLVDEPFDRQGWLFEVKWDGYRAIAELRQGATRLYSRNGKDFNAQFPSVVRSLSRFEGEAVLDGEITAVDRRGKADFQLLQNYLRTGQGSLVYFVFDLLYLDGYDLKEVPLVRRKQMLEEVLPASANIKLSVHIENRGLALYQFVSGKGIEGILAKDGASAYEEGVRSMSWQKVKTQIRQEAVIGGFTAPKGGRKWLGSLLLGAYTNGRLTYIGHSGGGFQERELESLYRRLLAHQRKNSPFRNLKSASGATWVEPELVCEVRFSEWTDEGLMRHPVFLGLRRDKEPREAVRENPSAPAGKKFKPVLRPVREEVEQTVPVSGKELKLTNLDKIFWPAQGYTKGDLIGYYRAVAREMLPFLVGRPQSLHRYPDGIYGKHFFHKDVGDLVPEWVQTFTVGEPGEEKVVYMLCQDEASLVYMVNLGCIEINPWNSRVQNPRHPDYMVLDFDPLMVPFAWVVKAVLETHRVLERIGCESYCKTSGAKGMHIYVPLGARHTYLQCRNFAELVNRLVNARLPAITSLERLPRKREKKVYLDFLQNAEGKTMAAPYSVRPSEGATVSCPLEWKEVNEQLDPAGFTIKTMPGRIRARRGMWSGVLGKGVDLLSCLTRLERLYKGR